MSWDIGGYHLDAGGKGSTVNLYTGDRGVDRFIKILPHPSNPDYVFFQPQHSNNVVDITNASTNPGARLQLWKKDNNNLGQMFKMIQIHGERDTYYLQNAKSGLYLTAHGKGKAITQERFNKDDKQKWYFQKTSGSEMAPPYTSRTYALENVMAQKVIDVPGAAPHQERKDGELQLWDMDDDPDRYVMLRKTGIGNYFYIQPLHSTEFWDVEGGKIGNGTDIQLWPGNKTAAQQFEFEYAGEPLTYWIKNRNSGRYVQAARNKIKENGSKLHINDKNGGDHQKWKLHFFDKFHMPPKDQAFFIKSAYINKYWDIGGDGAETNKNGVNFQTWDIGNAGDRKYKFLPTGDHSWLNIQVQNGGRQVDVEGQSKDAGAYLHLWDAHDGDSQKFAVQPTSPNTFVLRTKTWKTADISGGLSDDWKKNGQELKQQYIHYHANQQFQLIYADGPKYGQPYEFMPRILKPIMQKPAKLSEKEISFDTYKLNQEQITLLDVPRSDNSYTYLLADDGKVILSVFSNHSRRTHITKIKEINGIVNVYVEDSAANGASNKTVIKLDTTNTKISVKHLSGTNYRYVAPASDIQSGWEVELAREHAPQIRFHPREISYPSPVEGIVNRAYKAKPLSKNFTKLTTGQYPELSLNDSGTVLEIHRTNDRHHQGGLEYNYEIHYRVGQLNSNGSIDFTGHRKIETGVDPSIAINNNNNVVQVHRHSTNDGIDIRYGKLDTGSKKVGFNAKYDITNGQHPSIAINDDNIFIMVNERGGKLEYHFGQMNGSNLRFYKKNIMLYHAGYKPSVAINNLGQIVLAYEHNSRIYYLIGQFDDKYSSISFNRPTYVTTGRYPSIELNDDGDIIEIHQTSNKHMRENPEGSKGVYTMLHYRYGELRMNYGISEPAIEFSKYIELCSGETPDIVLNNKEDVVQIHQTTSITNADLHYRTTTGDSRKVVTSLKDLPQWEKDYILVQKGKEGWEAPRIAVNRKLKIYAVVSKVDGNIEIEYNFFYPNNGTNIIGTEFLKHIGDWEKIYVTVDPSGKVLNYRYHHHAEASTFSKGDIKLVDGTHPVVYAALETHASYPDSDLLDVFETGDLTSDDGLIWNSYEDVDNLEVVKIYGKIQDDNYWIHWDGRWGSTLNSPRSKLAW